MHILQTKQLVHKHKISNGLS